MNEQLDDALRTLLKGGGVVFFGLVFELSLAFFGKVIIARAIGPVNYGEVSLAITVLTVSSIITVMGLDVGLSRYIPRYDDTAHRRGLLLSSFQLSIPVGLLVGGGIVVFAPAIATYVFHDPSTTPLLRIFGAAVPLATFVKLAVGGMGGVKQSIPKVVIQNVGLPLTRFLGMAAAVFLGAGALGVSWAYFIAYAVAAVIGVYYLWRLTPLFDLGADYVPSHRKLVVFCAPLMVTAGMMTVFTQSDIFLLGFFDTTEAVGIYGVVYPVAQLLTIPISAFGFLFTPVFSELDAEDRRREMHQLYAVVSKWIFFVTLPLLLVMVFYPQLSIGIPFGGEYASGTFALIIVAIGFFIDATVGLNNNALTSLGHTRAIMYDNTIAALVNIALNVVLIPRYSFLGAAIATAGAFIVLNSLYSYQLYRARGIHPFSHRLLVTAAGAGVLAIGAYLAAGTLADGLVSLISFAALFGISYVVLILTLGVGRDEIMIAEAVEGQFGVDLAPMKRVIRRSKGEG